MTVGRKSGTPLWLSIASSLRSAIAAGQYPEGARLPTESELAGRYGVNRHTVRHAISKLADDGLVHSRRGAGTFVLARPLDYPLSNRVRFHQNLAEAGRAPGRELLSIEIRPATETEARRLALDPGEEICITHSRAFADGTPIILSESQYPEARHPGLALALQAGNGVTKAMADVGIKDYQRNWTRLTATIADATQAAHLHLREGAPLLLAESQNSSNGHPVEFGQSWFASDRVTLTLDHEERG